MSTYEVSLKSKTLLELQEMSSILQESVRYIVCASSRRRIRGKIQLIEEEIASR